MIQIRLEMECWHQRHCAYYSRPLAYGSVVGSYHLVSVMVVLVICIWRKGSLAE